MENLHIHDMSVLYLSVVYCMQLLFDTATKLN